MYCIEVKKLTSKYFAGTPLETTALKDINLTINKGEFLALLGASGSGKSTLVLHFNGLLLPTSGLVRVLGQVTTDKKHQSKLWSKVGLVFQFPERQIFSTTVFDDIAYGLHQLGLGADEVSLRVAKALEQVGLPRRLENADPLRLSGGTLRRVAIAGVLAMQPQVLVLDEPGAGLEPRAKIDLLQQIKQLQTNNHTTVILITHNLDDVATYADRVAILKQGHLITVGDTRTVLSNLSLMEQTDLEPPWAVQLYQRLCQFGITLPQVPLTKTEAEGILGNLLKLKQQ